MSLIHHWKYTKRIYNVQITTHMKEMKFRIRRGSKICHQKNISETLFILNLESLELRRLYSDLKMYFLIIHKLID